MIRLEWWRCRKCEHVVVVYGHASAVEHKCPKTAKYERLEVGHGELPAL